jgi:hypothetical protein
MPQLQLLVLTQYDLQECTQLSSRCVHSAPPICRTHGSNGVGRKAGDHRHNLAGCQLHQASYVRRCRVQQTEHGTFKVYLYSRTLLDPATPRAAATEYKNSSAGNASRAVTATTAMMRGRGSAMKMSERNTRCSVGSAVEAEAQGTQKRDWSRVRVLGRGEGGGGVGLLHPAGCLRRTFDEMHSILLRQSRCAVCQKQLQGV